MTERKRFKEYMKDVSGDFKKDIVGCNKLLRRLVIDVASLGLGYGFMNVLFDRITSYKIIVYDPNIAMTFDYIFRYLTLFMCILITSYGVGRLLMVVVEHFMWVLAYIPMFLYFYFIVNPLDKLLLKEKPSNIRQVLVFLIELAPLIVLAYVVLQMAK